jgi:hypothetical protein
MTTETETPHRTAIFSPSVTLDSDGIIAIDWSSSYTYTVWEEIDPATGKPCIAEDYDDTAKDAERMDEILAGTGPLTTAEQLRRLADAAEAAEAAKAQREATR